LRGLGEVPTRLVRVGMNPLDRHVLGRAPLVEFDQVLVFFTEQGREAAA
jgi:hypothetical protein